MTFPVCEDGRGDMAGRPVRRTLLLVVIAGMALAASVPAHAQPEAITIGEMMIQVWPEYDQPSVLVLYRGQVAEGPPLPVELRFPLPPDAVFHAAAYFDPATGDLLNAPHVVEGEAVVISSPNGTFHIEFYDPALQIDGERRDYTLAWEANYPVRRLTWEIQQPPIARSFSVDPAGGTLFVGEDGLAYYSVSLSELAPGDTAVLSVSYLNPEGALTRDLAEPGRAISPLLILAGLAMLGLGIAAGVSLYVRASRRKSRRRPSSPASEPAEETPLSAREIEVLALVAEGLSNRDISEQLGISPKTVARHCENIMAKLGIHNRVELTRHAIKIGLIYIDEQL